MEIQPITSKKYKCKQCGHIAMQQTNHYLDTYSNGRWNCCPNCPPFRKFPEYGGHTVWQCIEPQPPQDIIEKHQADDRAIEEHNSLTDDFEPLT